MSARSRILFLSQCLPYPPHSGVTSRTFNVLKQLQQEFDVVLLAYFRRNHQPDPDARQAARRALEKCVTRVGTPVAIRAEHAITRRLWDHLRSVLTGRAYTYYEHESRDYRDQLQRALAEAPPALIHLDGLNLHGWLPDLPPVPQVCTHHNIESDVLRLRAARTTSPLLRRYVLHQAGLVAGLERRLSPRLRLHVLTADLDRERLRRLGPGAPTNLPPDRGGPAVFLPGPSAAGGARAGGFPGG